MKGPWDERPYHSLDWELKRLYGKKLYKLSLNGGMSCPNRDGSKGTGGCIFCSGGGSGEFASGAALSVKEQLAAAKELVKKKLPRRAPGGYIAYFQAYTNTYGPLPLLERLFTEAMDDDEVEILSVATRPDCLPDEVIKLLSRLNRRKPVWVELGLQTIHEKTAKWIRRGYPLSCFDGAARRLEEAGIPLTAHVILGLPGEGRKELLETIDHLNRLRIWGVKLQLLHILSGTGLEESFRAGRVRALSFEEYEELLFSAIARLRPEAVIHRITGDGPKRLLLAPLWSGNKREVLNRLSRDMKAAGLLQGMNFKEEV